MARMSGNNESSVRNFGDSSKLINCILDLGLTCHMKPQVSYFIPCLLEDADKYIEVVDGHYCMAKQKGQVQTRMCNNGRDPFIVIWHNVILAQDI